MPCFALREIVPSSGIRRFFAVHLVFVRLKMGDQVVHSPKAFAGNAARAMVDVAVELGVRMGLALVARAVAGAFVCFHAAGAYMEVWSRLLGERRRGCCGEGCAMLPISSSGSNSENGRDVLSLVVIESL